MIPHNPQYLCRGQPIFIAGGGGGVNLKDFACCVMIKFPPPSVLPENHAIPHPPNTSAIPFPGDKSEWYLSEFKIYNRVGSICASTNDFYTN